MRRDGSRPTEGRPTKYRPEYCQKVVEFFTREIKTRRKTIITGKGTVIEEEIKDFPDYPSLVDFAGEIGVAESTIGLWQDKHSEFSASCGHALAKAKALLIKGGLSGAYDSNFSKFVAINCHGMHDKNETEVTGRNAGPLDITFTVVRAGEVREPKE
jgi:hypothetical protein